MQNTTHTARTDNASDRVLGNFLCRPATRLTVPGRSDGPEGTGLRRLSGPFSGGWCCLGVAGRGRPTSVPPCISEAVTRAAGIDPEPIPSRGVTRWTAQARRAGRSFAVRNLPAGLTRRRAADLMKERKRDTRRKILAGTCDRAEKDADAAEVMDETSIGSSQVYSQ